MIKVLIADDHEIVRRGVRDVVEGHPGWEVCGEALDGGEALRMAGELRPDIIIMDITMPVMTGLEATEKLTKHRPETKVLIFTMHESQQMKDEIARIGVQALAVKSAPMKNLLDTIKSVLGTDEPRVN